jgi:hypothetical protein
METHMRPLRIMIVLAPLFLAACGGTTEKTVVVNPPSDSTTVVDHNGHTVVHSPD